MGIVRLNQLPDGSGNLTNDDIFVFMDDPSGSGVTKKISLSEIGNAIGGGGGNPFDQNLNTTDSPTFNGIIFSDLTNQTTASPYTRSLISTDSAPSDLDNIKPIFGGTNTLDYSSTNCVIFNGGANTITHGINCTINGNSNTIDDTNTLGINSCHILGNLNEITTISDAANDCIIIGNSNYIASHGINSLCIIGHGINTSNINSSLLNNTLWVNNLAIKDGTLVILNLPTTNPGLPGAVWNDGGTLKIS